MRAQKYPKGTSKKITEMISMVLFWKL